MDYNTLFSHYNTIFNKLDSNEEGIGEETKRTREQSRKELSESEMAAEMSRDFVAVKLSVDDINERISRLAEMSDGNLKRYFPDYDINVIRNVLLRPVKQLADDDEMRRRAGNMVEARQFLTHYVADRVTEVAEGEGFERDVYDLITYNATKEIREERIRILQGEDAGAKKELFMSIMQNMESDINSLDMDSDLSDEYIIQNSEKLGRLASAAVIRNASGHFEADYGIEFSEDDKKRIDSVFDKEQGISWNFLNRIGVMASPYYPDVDVRELSRLAAIQSSYEDIFPSEDAVLNQVLKSASNYFEHRQEPDVQKQIEMFAESNKVSPKDISLRIADENGKVIILPEGADKSGIMYGGKITMMTPDKKHLADLDLSADDSLRFSPEKEPVRLIAGGLEGKAFAKDCTDLLAEMNNADHWYQRSSDEFRETKKLLNAIISGKPMSRSTAGENSEKLAKYADDYIAKHSNKALSERERARMDIMTKISRTFHAKQEAIEEAHQKAVEARNGNLFASEENRRSMSRQAAEEYELERVPHATKDVVMSAEDRVSAIKSDGAEQVEENIAEDEVTGEEAAEWFYEQYGDRAASTLKKLEQVENASFAYMKKQINSDIRSGSSQLYLLDGARAGNNLINYAKGLNEELPDDFDISKAMTEVTISSIIKIEREANNPGYLEKATGKEPVSITAGPFERFVTETDKEDVINVLKETTTIKSICRNMTPESVTDLLINHKEMQIARAIKKEISAPALSKAVENEKSRRKEIEVKKVDSRKLDAPKLDAPHLQ